MNTPRIDALALVSLLLLAFMGFHILKDSGASSSANLFLAAQFTAASSAPAPPADAAQPLAAQGGQAEAPAPASSADPLAFGAPYTSYVLTQGPHGYSYGHMAIDLSAGKGAEIISPINGIVTELYIDEYQNTVLVIENEVYQVLLMHGNYTVAVGETVGLGQIIGTESNNGYTKDTYGNLCYGRDCGYHTHLNVFDKRLGSNVNPSDLLAP